MEATRGGSPDSNRPSLGSVAEGRRDQCQRARHEEGTRRSLQRPESNHEFRRRRESDCCGGDREPDETDAKNEATTQHVTDRAGNEDQ